MKIHYLNCFTCNARIPSYWRSGALCLLIESTDGLVLVDTGPGLSDYVHKPGIVRTFQLLTKVPLNPEEAAVRQIVRLGYSPEDVRDIVLTHMHFDHCGGLPDFPRAIVHVHARELTAFSGRPHSWVELAYVRRHIAHKPRFIRYSENGERWYDFKACRLKLQPEMLLVPLFGHTRGHCGVAIKIGAGWLFHVADAGPLGMDEYAPPWLIRLVLGSHVDRLRAFRDAHPEVRMTTGHMWLSFFD